MVYGNNVREKGHFWGRDTNLELTKIKYTILSLNYQKIEQLHIINNEFHKNQWDSNPINL